MAHPDDEPRVRPLPMDGTQPERPVVPGRNPSVVISAVAAGLALALLLVVFGTGGGEPPAPATTAPAIVSADAGDLIATTTTLPPPLSSLLPISMERLSVLAGPADSRLFLWRPHERYGRSYRLPGDAVEAWFDASGEAIAFLDANGGLFTGPTPGNAAGRVAGGVEAARFHPTAGGELAYTAGDPASDAVALFRVRSEPDLLGGVEASAVARVPPTSRLLTWGDWGYALALAEPEAVVILDRSGAPVRVVAGRASAAGGDVFFLDAGDATADAADLAELAPSVVPATGIVGVVSVDFEPIYLFPGDPPSPDSVTISNDGVRIAVATLTSTGGTSVTVRDRTEETLRTIRIERPVRVLGFVGGGHFLALSDPEADEIVIADWRNGARYRVPGLPGNVLAVHF